MYSTTIVCIYVFKVSKVIELRPFFSQITRKNHFLKFHFIFSFQAQSEISENPNAVYIPREDWEPYDPMLIADGLFAAGNIFAYVKLPITNFFKKKSLCNLVALINLTLL